MTKRGFILGEYDTAADGHFTLNKWSLSEPKQKTNYLNIAYGDGEIDYTDVYDNTPRYEMRTLSITLISSFATRNARRLIIEDMVNNLDGFLTLIAFPDFPRKTMSGRISVTDKTESPYYSTVVITGKMEPYLWSEYRTQLVVPPSDGNAEITISNNGRPATEIVCDASNYFAIFKGASQSYTSPAKGGINLQTGIYIPRGKSVISIAGAPTTIKWKEGSLIP